MRTCTSYLTAKLSTVSQRCKGCEIAKWVRPREKKCGDGTPTTWRRFQSALKHATSRAGSEAAARQARLTQATRASAGPWRRAKMRRSTSASSDGRGANRKAKSAASSAIVVRDCDRFHHRCGFTREGEGRRRCRPPSAGYWHGYLTSNSRLDFGYLQARILMDSCRFFIIS